MPVGKQGILFKYFDKAICAVVALAVLAALFYTVKRAGALGREEPPEKAATIIQQIEAKLRSGTASNALEKKAYLTGVLDRIQKVPSPVPLGRDPFRPPLPERHSTVRIGLNRTFILELESPFKPDSVHVRGSEKTLELRDYPADGDYRQVRLRSGNREGKAVVEGESDSVKHEYPIVVNAQVGKIAHPPSKLTAAGRRGTVTLRIEPNRDNDDEGVKVVKYEVWRRDWVDPLGEYGKVGEAVAGAVAESSSRRTAPAAGGPTAGPRGAPMAWRAQEPQPAKKGARAEWRDQKVRPGQAYSYKARTVGSNTYPAAGEFTRPIMVKVEPNVDFAFQRSTGETVGFDVAKRFSAGVEKETFWVSVGQEIGGISKDGGEVRSFLTGLVMVDFHRGVLLPGVGVTDRVIYADREGNLHMRLRRERGSSIWDEKKESERSTRASPARAGARVPAGPGLRRPRR
ncbi:MAG: hypothetical protein ACYS8L_10430 [Planctomycetota bacterium]|jgi:hypothetical protein